MGHVEFPVLNLLLYEATANSGKVGFSQNYAYQGSHKKDFSILGSRLVGDMAMGTST